MIEVGNFRRKIIAIIGPIGSGKDTIGEYISKKLNIPIFQISKPLKDFALEKNIEPTRENLIKIGSGIAKEKGPGFFIKILLSKNPENFMIITGLRMLEGIEYLKANHDLILLSIDADPEIRFERSTVRHKLGEAKTFDEFIENEQTENSAPNAQRVFECMELADYSITNDGTVEELYKKVDEFLVNKSIK